MRCGQKVCAGPRRAGRLLFLTHHSRVHRRAARGLTHWIAGRYNGLIANRYRCAWSVVFALARPCRERESARPGTRRARKHKKSRHMQAQPHARTPEAEPTRTRRARADARSDV